MSALPRLRQAVIAARELDAVVERLRGALALREPFHDEAVGYFGLRNAVFALGNTFLEVVSPAREDTAAARQLARRGGDCGYMVMVQVEDLAGARARAASLGIREVFEVSLDDISEVHLHPADIRGAIVSLSEPRPASAWRWGGPDWEARAADARLAGVTIAVRDVAEVASRWEHVLGAPADQTGVRFVQDAQETGLVEIAISGVGGAGGGSWIELGMLRLALHR